MGATARLIVVGALAAVGVALLVAMAVAPRPGAGAAMAVEAGCPAPGNPPRSGASRLQAVDPLSDQRGAGSANSAGSRATRPSGGGARAQRAHGRDQLPRAPMPGEEDLETRLREAGYFDGAGHVAVRREHRLRPERRGDGRQLDGDRFHRVNILERRFHEIGVGAVEGGSRTSAEGYATFVVVLGWHDGGTAPLSGSASGSGVGAQASSAHCGRGVVGNLEPSKLTSPVRSRSPALDSLP